MKKNLLAVIILAALPVSVHAADWTGTGEFGFVMARGNADTDALNLKLGMKKDADNWLHEYYAAALRASVNGDASASRFELGGKSGYKFSDTSYMFGALRYENDDFASYEHQTTFSAGYGFWAIKDETTNLQFEIGPGVRRAKLISGETESDAILRGWMNYSHKFNASTELYETLLVEASSDNKFVQNDFGVQVKMSDALALKAGLQWRHNSDVPVGVKKNDTLTTLNLVYGF